MGVGVMSMHSRGHANKKTFNQNMIWAFRMQNLLLQSKMFRDFFFCVCDCGGQNFKIISLRMMMAFVVNFTCS